MDRLKTLSPAQCILLAVNLAADANIEHLCHFTPLRPEVFDTQLIYRILLTYLPESLDPDAYLNYVLEVDRHLYLQENASPELDTSTVENLSETQARRQLKKLHLLPLGCPFVPAGHKKAELACFLIQRSHRIEHETGLLTLVPRLVTPFLDKSEYIREWYVSIVLPLMRMDYEYYPEESLKITLDAFESLRGSRGIHVLLARVTKASRKGTTSSQQVARDFRCLLGPWIYGSSGRKRRALEGSQPPILLRAVDAEIEVVDQPVDTERHSGSESELKSDWQNVFNYFVTEAQTNFSFAVEAIEEWGGPEDVDFGGHGKEYFQRDDEVMKELLHLYCKACFASIYMAEQDTQETIEGAHAVLCRLAQLLDFEPPPELATSINLLPQIEKSDPTSGTRPHLEKLDLLGENNPLTNTSLKSFALLQMLVYSAYQLANLSEKTSLANIARLRFWSSETEQLKKIQHILHGLVHGPPRSEEKWADHREALLWLRDWALETPNEIDHHDIGYGAFGKVPRSVVEFEVLRALCTVGHSGLASRIYLDPTPPRQPLSPADVETVVVGLALEHYDNASNGNKTRGGMKKAVDILAHFQKYYHGSSAFRSCLALVSATHSLSFYTLTLQRGIPFRPVNIRVADEPVALLVKVLEQNKGSYTKLDDLLEIGRNLIKANTAALSNPQTCRDRPVRDEAGLLRAAEHRIVGMAIEAALREDDFETAYSYVVNRLDVVQFASSEMRDQEDSIPADDISWRAALAAGKHSSPSTTRQNTSTAHLRRLEQRMELLSHALVLAPAPHLPEVLAAWRRCEEELTIVHAQESADEQRWNDAADSREMVVPGGFGGPAEPGFTVQPRRKEMGRGAVEESPMGLFDVAKGAAAAFGRSAGAFKVPAGLGAGTSSGEGGSGRSSAEMAREAGAHGERVRKRDMVASAVTGGLASGIGWVLGATPAHESQR